METLSTGAAKLRWGILATGHIAKRFADALRPSRTGQLVAVASRSQAAADRFAAGFPGIRAHGSYRALLDDPGVDAVYIATPHPMHAEWALRAAEAGKHILCEKPLAMNAAEAGAMVDAARRHRVFLMEAFMYRCHPQTAGVIELVQAGVVGELRRIECRFILQRTFDAAHRLFNRDLGGGGILDLGCYPMSYSRLIAGASRGEPFANPDSLTGEGELDAATGTDVSATATVRFADGVVAELGCALNAPKQVIARIEGSDGAIEVPSPFAPGFNGNEDWVFVRRPGEEDARIFCRSESSVFTLEADEVGDCVRRGELESAAMPHADTLANMACLDAWRALLGVRYEADRR
jgi:predicted dehydrogenase